MHLHFIMVVHCSKEKKINISPPKEFKMKKLCQTCILGQIMKFGMWGCRRWRCLLYKSHFTRRMKHLATFVRLEIMFSFFLSVYPHVIHLLSWEHDTLPCVLI